MSMLIWGKNWLVLVSLPSRERGLKSGGTAGCQPSLIVAPLAGAWIEITDLSIKAAQASGRSPRGSVD